MNPMTSDLLARAAARLRDLPVGTPHFGSDAILLLADALQADAAELSLRDGALGNATRMLLINEMRSLAERAQALAPLFAPTTPLSAAPDLLRREHLT